MNHRITTECPKCGLKLVIKHEDDPDSFELSGECDCNIPDKVIEKIINEYYKSGDF